MRVPLLLLACVCSSSVACATAVAPADDPVAPPLDDAGATDARKPSGDGSAFKPTDGGPSDPDTGVSSDDAGTDAPTPIDASVDAGNDAQAPLDASVDSGSVCAFVQSGTLLTFDFSSEPGNQASTAPKSSASGITGGAISRANTLNSVMGSGSINASNWSLGKLDATRYYTFTITPDPKCALDVTSISIDTKASGTGPSDGAIATSADNFASATSFATNSVTAVSASVKGQNGKVEVRVYGYNATGSGGTMRIENTLTITGALK